MSFHVTYTKLSPSNSVSHLVLQILHLIILIIGSITDILDFLFRDSPLNQITDIIHLDLLLLL
jgi:hypothetical protein